MPFYDYDCPSCGMFEASRRIAERDEALPCPSCGDLAPRHINTKAASVGGADSDGDSAGSYGMRHRGGCSCC